MMRLSFLLACASLFVSAVAGTTTIDATTAIENSNSNINTELPMIDMEHQQRRKTWDVFGLLLMMVGNGDCGPHGAVHLLDCHTYEKCQSGQNDQCEKLCDMSSHHGKSHYSAFCTTSTSQASEANTADSYQDSATPGSVSMDGNYSMGFQFWMVAAAASVGLALVAVHMGQRKNDQQREELLEDEESQGASMTGSVGRRMVAVSALADGYMAGSGASGTQVEMAEYKLEEQPPSSPYPKSSFA